MVIYPEKEWDWVEMSQIVAHSKAIFNMFNLQEKISICLELPRTNIQDKAQKMVHDGSNRERKTR